MLPDVIINYHCHFITGPATHSGGGQTSNGRWCLSSSSVTPAHMQRKSQGGSTRRRASSVTGRHLVMLELVKLESNLNILLSSNPDGIFNSGPRGCKNRSDLSCGYFCQFQLSYQSNFLVLDPFPGRTLHKTAVIFLVHIACTQWIGFRLLLQTE